MVANREKQLHSSMNTSLLLLLNEKMEKKKVKCRVTCNSYLLFFLNFSCAIDDVPSPSPRLWFRSFLTSLKKQRSCRNFQNALDTHKHQYLFKELVRP